MAAAVSRSVLTSLRSGGPAATVRGGVTGSVCHKSTYTYSALPNDYNCKVDLALTSDRKTIVCYHPSVDVLYEHTKPIPRLSPVENKEETHEQVLKARLETEMLRNKPAPTIEELSKMFYTTKHRWFPIGQYRRRRIKANPPKDR
ncbi:39S ribosomal protein L42, mitochondrial [Callorhinchus milii]|uniref:Large ribosomal subunit protein mL42 n=2 Tax=Callorhinchus milii TaxID=7868 RepID=K4G9V1_CALMI|nr:39S ribosomal protein L42, mitochondrial [Callorhinchus milii]AFM85663.1 39S ribosomal protein L42, mitochondrial-like protein [Callorhinchus milii]AFM87420.1 39S ribosomal protein L42, mitochondrial-like protein [Callorhinchus milii]|eukprot:gi/632980732/ref/XP_007907198.1/ PREDICTED: 39S ribosomal protein L42, mitochondrial [Callorhinchus milii]